MNLPAQNNKKWWRATLSIFSTTLTPQEISARLGLEPTGTHTKGQPRGFRRKDGSISPSIVWKDSAWHLTSPLQRDRNLAEHLMWLLDVIEPKLQVIESLRSECEIIRLFCGFASHNGQGGFTLDARTLGRMSKLDVPLGVDLYPPTDPEHDEEEAEEDPTMIQ